MKAPVAADETQWDADAAAYSVGTHGFQFVHDREIAFEKNQNKIDFPYVSFYEAVVKDSKSGSGANFTNPHSMTFEEQVLYVCYKCARDAVGFWNIVKLSKRFQEEVSYRANKSFTIGGWRVKAFKDGLLPAKEGVSTTIFSRIGYFIKLSRQGARFKFKEIVAAIIEAQNKAKRQDVVRVCFAEAVIGWNAGLEKDELAQLHIRGFDLADPGDLNKYAFEEESAANRMAVLGSGSVS